MLIQPVDHSIVPLTTASGGILYRGVDIKMDAQGTSFSFEIPDYPLMGWAGLSCLETAEKLVDAWLDRPRSESTMDASS